MKKLLVLLVLLGLFLSAEVSSQVLDPFKVASFIALSKGEVEQNNEEALTIRSRHDGLVISRVYIRKWGTISDEVCIMIFDMKAGIVVTFFEKNQRYSIDKYTGQGEMIDTDANRVDAETAKFVAAAILRKYLSSSDLQ